MISVIICSREKNRLQRLLKNIDETIGVPYEIIATDNVIKRQGICAVYNAAARSARFSLLCFVHEDIQFSTQGWGCRVSDHLQNNSTGLIGIAGGDAKSLVPSSWYVPARSNHIHVFQHYRHREAAPEHIRVTDGGVDERAREVSALDGVFLCTRKDVFALYQFDEKNFPGFHGYDIDYSLQVSASYRLLVVFDILIHHYSEGQPGRDWMQSTLQISRKWKHRLPVSVHPLSPAEFRDHHWAAMQVFLQRLVNLHYPARVILPLFFKYSFGRFFTLRRFGSMGKYLFNCLYERTRTKKPPAIAQLKVG